MAAKPLKHARGALDVDWKTIHMGEKEWVERDRDRNNKRLARYHGLSENGSGPRPHPWAALASSAITPGAASSRSQPYARDVTPRIADAVGPPLSSSMLRFSELPPATASSRCLSTASGPPRTSSTTLTSLWRRASSTPALRGASAGESSAHQGKGLEEWITSDLADGLDKDELGRLIEHVHSRLLRERRRRHEAQTELAAIKEDKALRRSAAIADRMPTPAVK